MLSILIPTYNDSCSTLVNSLDVQAKAIKEPLEIIILDDGSTNSNITLELEILEKRPLVTIIRNAKNKGRLKSRLALANAAKFDWLLFLDADVLPCASNFLKQYLLETELSHPFVFGGVSYKDDVSPAKEFRLHWLYGKTREQRDVTVRKNNPYNTIVSANMCVHKSSFLQITSTNATSNYGTDIIFLEAIKQSGKNVKHIHNPVYHLGLEPIHRYLPKQIEALTTLKQQVEAGNLAAKERPLHKAYLSLNQFYMTAIFQNLYSLFSKYIMANLNSASPSIRCFDLFKLYHYSKLYN